MPKINDNLWLLSRLAFRTADYPDNCRYFEGVYITKVEGDFDPSEGRPISLGNVQGKVYIMDDACLLTALTYDMYNVHNEFRHLFEYYNIMVDFVNAVLYWVVSFQ